MKTRYEIKTTPVSIMEEETIYRNVSFYKWKAKKFLLLWKTVTPDEVEIINVDNMLSISIKSYKVDE